MLQDSKGSSSVHTQKMLGKKRRCYIHNTRFQHNDPILGKEHIVNEKNVQNPIVSTRLAWTLRQRHAWSVTTS